MRYWIHVLLYLISFFYDISTVACVVELWSDKNWLNNITLVFSFDDSGSSNLKCAYKLYIYQLINHTLYICVYNQAQIKLLVFFGYRIFKQYAVHSTPVHWLYSFDSVFCATFVHDKITCFWYYENWSKNKSATKISSVDRATHKEPSCELKSYAH